MISTRSQLPLLASGSWADAVGVDQPRASRVVADCVDRGLVTRPLKDRITVPFCPESKLSGIGNTDYPHG